MMRFSAYQDATEDQLKKHTESLPKKITPIFIPATKSASAV